MTQEERQDLRNWRQEHGRFVARETGTRFLRPLCQYDIRMQAPPQKVAQSLGDLGRMPHTIAMQEARAHAQETAARPDIDPDDDLRGAMLQGLVRSGLFPDAGGAEAAPGANEAPPPVAGHPLVQLALVMLLAKNPRKRGEGGLISPARYM